MSDDSIVNEIKSPHKFSEKSIQPADDMDSIDELVLLRKEI